MVAKKARNQPRGEMLMTFLADHPGAKFDNRELAEKLEWPHKMVVNTSSRLAKVGKIDADTTETPHKYSLGQGLPKAPVPKNGRKTVAKTNKKIVGDAKTIEFRIAGMSVVVGKSNGRVLIEIIE